MLIDNSTTFNVLFKAMTILGGRCFIFTSHNAKKKKNHTGPKVNLNFHYAQYFHQISG